MKLYFSPLACSLASRIALYEANAPAELIEVDPKSKRTKQGADFRAVYPLGLVPALTRDDGSLITENSAILQYLAARFPEAKLAPENIEGRAELHKWLSFVSAELHKAVFVPLLDEHAPEGAKAYALSKAAPRLSFLNEHLAGRKFLLEAFSVADAYLLAVLNWAFVTPVDLKQFPHIAAYASELRKRPSVARAMAEERPLFAEELARAGKKLELPSAQV